jgi:AraC-like DNA-binding protein
MLGNVAKGMRTSSSMESAAMEISAHRLNNITHELRTPLTQISAPLEVLKNADGSLSESERRHLYGIIGVQTSRMLELIDQLLQNTGETSRLMNQSQAEAAPNETQYAIGSSGLTPKGRRSTNCDDGLLDKLFRLMEENLEETDFSVHKMCGMVHMSHMQFIRKVKQLTGKKPIDLLKSFRLKRAKDLLRENKLTVAEIAYKVGYDMPNSFSRAFKKEFGICPSEYKG